MKRRLVVEIWVGRQRASCEVGDLSHHIDTNDILPYFLSGV